MKQLRAVVVDDEPLPRERVVSLVREHGGIDVVAECSSGTDALRVLRAERPDIVFLDIEMPELTGFEVIAQLASTGEVLPAVIFVTAYDDYAIKAFDVDAVDYLLKPVMPDRFARSLERVVARIAEPQASTDRRLHDFVERMQREREYASRFVVKNGARSMFVAVRDIDWIDVATNQVRLHCAGKAHLLRETLSGVEQQLNPAHFVRIHRSIIINVDRVREIESREHGEYFITMSDGARLQSSRTHSERLRQLIK